MVNPQYVPPPSINETIKVYNDKTLRLLQSGGAELRVEHTGNPAADENLKILKSIQSRNDQLHVSQGIKGGRPRKKRRFKTLKNIKRNYGRHSKRFRFVRKHSRKNYKQQFFSRVVV